jgi:4-hydroxybenzoyl-CoA reductase subunit beta
MPRFELLEPTTLDAALAALTERPGTSMVIAGGTDLLPNLKHELFTPQRVVSLARIESLRCVRELDQGWLSLGAMLKLEEIAGHALLQERYPALAQAAGLVAGPQLRTMGTLGGNVLLDTRCQWYNQTYFWRQALGFCLKKDGTLCHVVEGGSKCVAAASNDTAPALMTLGAELVIVGPQGRRVVSINDFWLADGAANKKLESGEILVEIRLPPTKAGQRGAYGKLRMRDSIDFPLLSVAARVDLDPAGTVSHADLVIGALQARPVRIKKLDTVLRDIDTGSEAWKSALHQAADLAYKQCHPMPNIPGDQEWRREMVPVYVRHTLEAAVRGGGPIHGL